jgi:hypothetical protein
MLEKLREKLDAGVTWDVKRQLVEVLVDGVTVETTGDEKSRQAIVNVRYRFVSSVDTCTDTRAGFKCTFARIHRAVDKRAA